MKLDKVIFLDVDGVLNSTYSMMINKKEGELFVDLPYAEHVAILNNITDRTNSPIVISSTWRIGEHLHSLRRLFYLAGVKGSIIGMTPVHKGEHTLRGNEITEWLQTNAPSLLITRRFVILDDDSDMADLMDNLIQTDFHTGLRIEHSYRAIAILNGGLIK